MLRSLKGIQCKLIKSSGRFYVENYLPEDENTIISRLTKVFGIHSVSPATCINTDMERIYRAASDSISDKGTFRVTVKRADKRITTKSMQIAAEIGAFILKDKPSLKVDLFEPDNEILVDIRENGKTYVMCRKIMGSGGMPVGSAGNGLLLLSGGIDSPVAGYMMAKRGMTVKAIHFHSFPYTSEKAKEKVMELARIVSEYTGPIEMNIVSLTEIQREIHMKCPKEYMITLVRRFMLRIANIIAEKENCKALVTGESLGQVASQTLESIGVISAVSKLQILRPLIGMDKSEIISIADKIGTFKTSIEPYEDCCTVFLPENPVIRPTIDRAFAAEEALDVDKLIEDALNTLERVKISKA
jgi:thiamine biosynthesis protein ThiI